MFDFFKITPKKRSVKIRKKYGILYSNPSGMKRLLFYVGTIIVSISIVYLGYLYKPLVSSLLTYKFSSKKENESIVITEEKNIEESDEFLVVIPKISAKSDIIENISPYNPDEYLTVINENKIAHSKLSSIPGLGKNTSTYIFAHSTQQGLNMVRKNSVFYLLDKLITDDLVYIRYKGNFYKYRVYDKKIVNHKEVEYLTFKDPEKEVLVMQTCWPLGTDWKRLLVFAERI